MYFGLKNIANDQNSAIINWGNNPTNSPIADRLLFVFTAVICSYFVAALFNDLLPGIFLWGILQRLCSGLTWILIALSLGSITSSASSVAILVVISLLSFLSPHLPNDIHWIVPILKKTLHYMTPAFWATDFLGESGWNNQSLLLNAAVLLDNFMYGIVVFLGCAWVFAKRDLKLRE